VRQMESESHSAWQARRKIEPNGGARWHSIPVRCTSRQERRSPWSEHTSLHRTRRRWLASQPAGTHGTSGPPGIRGRN
jgi:hypothetical protein